jgi:type I site-specific restriction endonuclease
VPSGQRRRRQRLARDPRILFIGHPDWADRHPKETETVSNIDYFGDPVYTYSLKEGIEDGFLAPYKVVRVDIDKDLQAGAPPGRWTNRAT